jgi:hypothetical protein
VRRAALAATLVLLVGSAPAAADLFFIAFVPGVTGGVRTTCNPSEAIEEVPQLPIGGRLPGLPIFVDGVAWVDYFGVPVAFSPPFTVYSLDSFLFGSTGEIGAVWPWPNPSSLLPGQYTMHVLLQGNGALGLPGGPFGPAPGSPGFGPAVFLYFLFTTVSATATINPSLPPGCPPTATTASASAARAATLMPSASVLARRARALRHTSVNWFGRSTGPRPTYPRARACGRTVCVQLRAGERWKPVTNG